MNSKVIIEVLQERNGEGVHPERGIEGDDILLSNFFHLQENNHHQFWKEFSDSVDYIWRKRDIIAISNATAFLSRLPPEKLPENSQIIAKPIITSLGHIDADETNFTEFDSIGLRIAVIVKVKNEKWWLNQFYYWKERAITATPNSNNYIWQSILHASQGILLSNDYPNLDAVLDLAVRSDEKYFPALEVFTLLTYLIKLDDSIEAKNNLRSKIENIYISLLPVALEYPITMEYLNETLNLWLQENFAEAPLIPKIHKVHNQSPKKRFTRKTEAAGC